jgi:hypothetical protein
MKDQEIVDMVHQTANAFNHALHVAHHHGVHIQLTTADEPLLRVSSIFAARPILPSRACETPAEGAG